MFDEKWWCKKVKIKSNQIKTVYKWKNMFEVTCSEAKVKFKADFFSDIFRIKLIQLKMLTMFQPITKM